MIFIRINKFIINLNIRLHVIVIGFSQIIPFQTGLHIADTAGIHDHPCIGECKVTS